MYTLLSSLPFQQELSSPQCQDCWAVVSWSPSLSNGEKCKICQQNWSYYGGMSICCIVYILHRMQLFGSYRMTHLKSYTIWWVSEHCSLRWIPKIRTWTYIWAPQSSQISLLDIFSSLFLANSIMLRIHKEKKYTGICQNHYDFLISCLSSRHGWSFPSWIRSARWSIVYYN